MKEKTKIPTFNKKNSLFYFFSTTYKGKEGIMEIQEPSIEEIEMLEKAAEQEEVMSAYENGLGIF